MTNHEFEFDENAALKYCLEFGLSAIPSVNFVEGARYQHNIDKENHEKIVSFYKKELDTVIKIGVEGQREVNRKLSVEIAKLKEQNAILIEALKNVSETKGLDLISIGLWPIQELINTIDYDTQIATEALKKIEELK